MLNWSIEQTEHPVMILIPGNGVIEDNRKIDTDYSNLNKFKVEQRGTKVAIFALGDFYQKGIEVANEIENILGFTPTLINPRFVSGIDKELLNELKKDHSVVITLEDGILDGGFGSSIASFYGIDNMKVKNYGLNKEFYDRYNPDELLKTLGITKEQITKDIKNLL